MDSMLKQDQMLRKSPFHRGEREVQSRLGVRDQVEKLGQRFIREYLPDEHREFYSMLSHLFVGTVDASGRPWASVIAGRPGFIETPDDRTLRINGSRLYGDPGNAGLLAGAPVGVLGIQYNARRRNRLTAKVANVTERSLTLRVDQTFGNCPQYIQARDAIITTDVDEAGDERPTVSFTRLNKRAAEIVANADNFYIATCYGEDAGNTSHGADVSHRGGKPGFVRIEDEKTLIFPDFPGNNHYNTVGNISMYPLAGLLFIDFDNGDLLYLTCSAEIVWDSEERRAFNGAERLVRFVIDEGLLVQAVMPIRWKFVDYSPVLERTGSWGDVDAAIEARRTANRHRDYRVVRVERESSVITSFYLQPANSESITCHKAGQFLPIEIFPGGDDNEVRRTYTISSGPNGKYYRLSIKREPPARDDLPPGLASNYFHDNVRPGSVIRTYPPRGTFVLEENSLRPVVLLSGGVGVTPMISMLDQLASESDSCGCARQVWFIHGAISSREHAFGLYVRNLAESWPCLNTHFAYSHPADTDVIGEDYDSHGFISVDLLKSLLPLDDYDYYFCGPPPFMKSIHAGLKALNVVDDRIHYEFFGPGANLLQENPGKSAGLLAKRRDMRPVPVKFARSGISTVWIPTKGTLLDLAEAEGLNPEYSCRSGICSTCQTKMTKGEVDYVDPPIAEPDEGTALICCSYPDEQSDEIILEL